MKGKTKKSESDDNKKTKSVNSTRKSVHSESSKSNKVEKRKPKMSKAKLAQRQIKKMQTLGLLGAPPRRAASLNAAAMIHISEVASITSPEKSQQTNVSAIGKAD